MTYCILLAGGVGNRVGTGIPIITRLELYSLIPKVLNMLVFFHRRLTSKDI